MDNQITLQFHRPKKFVLIHWLQMKLNSLLFDDKFDERKASILYRKGPKINRYRAERKGLIVQLTCYNNKREHWKTGFHHGLWPDNFYEQNLFLSSLLSFIFADEIGPIDFSDAAKAIQEVMK